MKTSDLVFSINRRGCAIEELRELRKELLASKETELPIFVRGCLNVSMSKEEVLGQLNVAIHREKEAMADLLRQLTTFIEAPDAPELSNE